MNKSKVMQKASLPNLKRSNSMNGRKRSSSIRSKSKKLNRGMVARDFDLPVQAVKEAVKVASKALDKYEGAYAQAA